MVKWKGVVSIPHRAERIVRIWVPAGRIRFLPFRTPSPAVIALRVLLVEDNQDDAFLLERYLRQTGFEPSFHRVDDADGLREALTMGPWDLVLSDFHLPGFSGLAALEILKSTGIDIPFILVSGAIGEHTAVEAMRAGARDYILKENLARLGPAIRRELLECAERNARRSSEERQRTLENAIQAILDGTSHEWGVDFFRSLVSSLAKSLGFKAALAAELDPVASTARILAAHGLEMDTGDHPITGTFTGEILRNRNASAQDSDFDKYVDGALAGRWGIRAMAGIRLDSRDGEPRGLLVVSARSPDPVVVEGGMPRGQGERILVVDDEPAITDILSHLLEILGYRCRAFTRPRAALDEFRLDPGSWSAVISDYTMPELTGRQLAREIHLLDPVIPVLLTSGYEVFDREDDPLPDDIFSFVPKPFQAEDIARLLHDCLAKR